MAGGGRASAAASPTFRGSGLGFGRGGEGGRGPPRRPIAQGEQDPLMSLEKVPSKDNDLGLFGIAGIESRLLLLSRFRTALPNERKREKPFQAQKRGERDVLFSLFFTVGVPRPHPPWLPVSAMCPRGELAGMTPSLASPFQASAKKKRKEWRKRK